MSQPQISIPELENDPLGNIVLDYLIDHDSEEPYLDFKQALSIEKGGRFAEIAKDLLAFCNYGGGFILVGYRDKSKDPAELRQKGGRQFVPIGLGRDYHIDQASLQEKFNSYALAPVSVGYREFRRKIDGEERLFAAVYVPPGTELMKAAKGGSYTGVDGKTHTPIKTGEVLFRRGTQSVPASRAEVQFILDRIQNTQYRLSILSGQPDRIKETVYSNLFEATFKTHSVYFGSPNRSYYASLIREPIPHDYLTIRWLYFDVSFEDLTQETNPLRKTLVPETIRQESLKGWFSDEDKKKVLIRLLNKELWFLARRLGLLRVEKRHRYYFPCLAESRSESWKPRYRESSSLMVAQKLYLRQLGKKACVHLAVNASFTAIEDTFALRLSPTLMLTEDGKKAIYGEKEGAVITSLLRTRYNQTYLNQLLFWISRFAEGREHVSLAHGKALVSAEPIESSVNVGILADRPVAEGVPEMSYGDVG